MPTGKKGPTKELDDLCMLSLYSDLKYHVIHGGIVYTKKPWLLPQKWIKTGGSTVMLPLNHFWDL